MNLKRELEENKNGLIFGFIIGYFMLFLLSQTFIPITYLDSLKAQLTQQGISFQELLSRAGIIYLVGTTLLGGILYKYSSYLRNKVNFTKKQIWYTTVILASVFVIGQGTDLFAFKGLGGFLGKMIGGKFGFLGIGALVAPLLALNPILGFIAIIAAFLIFGLPFIGLGIAILTNFKLILFTIVGAIILIALLKGGKR